jgi:hypothetical protein
MPHVDSSLLNLVYDYIQTLTLFMLWLVFSLLSLFHSQVHSHDFLDLYHQAVFILLFLLRDIPLNDALRLVQRLLLSHYGLCLSLDFIDRQVRNLQWVLGLDCDLGLVKDACERVVAISRWLVFKGWLHAVVFLGSHTDFWSSSEDAP